MLMGKKQEAMIINTMTCREEEALQLRGANTNSDFCNHRQ
jgi:hypothetical protein